MKAPKNIFLVGYRGTGKTTVARLLARKLGWQCIDADALLEERHGRSIRQIFADDGEAAFRNLEAAILAELCRTEKQVVASGGGAVLRPENRAALKNSGLVVWLTADAQTLWSRMQNDPTTAERRPDLISGGIGEIEELLRTRQPWYAECAQLIVDTAKKTPEQVCAEILGEFGFGRG